MNDETSLTGGLRGSLGATPTPGPSSTYIRRLYNSLDKKRPYVTYNRDASHARVVVVAGVEHAQKEILLLSRHLDLDVYGGITAVEAMFSFLGRPGAKLNVLVEEGVAEAHPMLDLINRKDNATIKKVPESLTKKYQCNFMVVDDIGYRYEPNRDLFNATVAFHDEDKLGMIGTLRKLFNILNEKAVDVTTW